MTLAAMEINDAGVTLACDAGVVVQSPGYAFVADTQLCVGEPARRQWRVRPRATRSDFWQELSATALQRPSARAACIADLAAAHLAHVWEQRPRAVDALLLAVPGSFSKYQLGLLLGIAEQHRLPLHGVIDAALACCEQVVPGRCLAHLDLQLHQAVLTRLGQGTRVYRESTTTLPRAGLEDLHADWAARIAAQFVAETRFDPLHSGATDQELHDRLPRWLRQSCDQPETMVEMRAGDGRVYGITLTAQSLVGAAEDSYARIRQLVGNSRDGRPLSLMLSHRLRALPGLSASLAQLEDVELVAMRPGAAAIGALRHARAFADSHRRPGLTVSLPWQGKPPLRRPAGAPPRDAPPT